METIQYNDKIDKSNWGPGPWMDEPDHVQWQDEATGLPCLAHRNKFSGNWCGYVGVAEGHPYFEQSYEELDASVHGGLTFADFCAENTPEGEGICHVPGEGEPEKVWWFGFDCAHLYDLSPGTKMPIFDGEVYRNLNYVKEECQRLAAQLGEAR